MLVRQGLTCLLLGITAVAVVFLAAQDSSRMAQARVIYNRVVDDAGTNLHRVFCGPGLHDYRCRARRGCRQQRHLCM